MCAALTRDQVELVVASACAAPSIHNCQPWQFSVADDSLVLSAALDRVLPVSDPTARALYISCGAALFNTRVALRMLARDPLVRLLPHPDYSFVVLAVVEAGPGPPPTDAERERHESIWRRHTNRGPYSGEPIQPSVARKLQRAAEQENARLRWLDQAAAATALALAEQASKELAANHEHQAELRRWVAASRQDGIPVQALPLRPDRTPSPVRDTDFLAAAPDRATGVYERFPQLAVLTTEADEPDDWLRAGQALQCVLLAATASSVSASFLYQPIERDDMREPATSSWPWPENLQMIIRFGYGANQFPVPRRPLDSVLQPVPELRVC
jgi:nitroreductase